MSLKALYTFKAEGNTIPYPPRYDAHHNNAGFLDLRAKPEDINSLPEIMWSVSLRDLLLDLCHSCSPIMTLGCDLGEHVEEEETYASSMVAGGYVQICQSPISNSTEKALRSLANHIELRALDDSESHDWEIEFSLCISGFKFEEYLELPTLWIWFFAKASSMPIARFSRERLIKSINDGVRAYSAK